MAVQNQQIMSEDPESGSAKMRYARGYPSLAAFIASDCDHSTSIYRRFDRLSARNLLYLQSELAELEATQDALDSEDHQASTHDKQCLRNWQKLRERAKSPGNVKERRRLDLALEIRKKLQEYRESSVCPEYTDLYV